jgi:hypothetical protein
MTRDQIPQVETLPREDNHTPVSAPLDQTPTPSPHGSGVASPDLAPDPMADREFRVAHGWEDLVSLRAPWSQLADSALADGFDQPEFCIPCWAEGAQGSPYVVQAWEGEQLIALAPFWQRRLGPLRVFGEIGTSGFASSTPLVLPGREPVLTHLLERLLVARNVIELRYAGDTAIRAALAGSAAHTSHAETPGRAYSAAELAHGDTADLTVERDADAMIETGALFVPHDDAPATAVSPQLSSVLLQTVVDTVLRSGRGFLVRDGWDGAAVWVIGHGGPSLWWSFGTCAPGATHWTQALTLAAHTAHADGGLSVFVPPSAATSVSGGTPTVGTHLTLAATPLLLGLKRLLERPSAGHREVHG